MSNGNDRMDELLRKRMMQFSAEPPDRVWEGIRSGLAPAGNRRRIVYYRWLSAAAVILVAFITGITLWNPQRQLAPTTAEKKALPVTVPAATPGVVAVTVDAPAPGNEATEENLTVPQPGGNIVALTRENLSPETEPVASIRKPVTLASLEFKRITRLAGEVFHTGLEEMAVRKIEQSGRLSDTDRLIIASNLDHSGRKSMEGKSLWQVGVHLAPGYTSSASSHSEAYARNMTYSEDKARANVSGGISAQFKTRGRWRMESGMYYSRTGGSSGNSIGFQNDRADYATASNTAEKYFNTGVSVRNGQMSMNSTAGVISFSHTPSNAELISVPGTNAGLTAAMLTPGEFSQVFDFVEIPLVARYRLIEAAIDVDLMGGLSTNLLVGNNVYMENNGISERVGTTRDISTVNFSGTAGVGVVYALGKNISLSVEPRFNYYLNSINHSGDVDFKPWRVGVVTGLNYEF